MKISAVMQKTGLSKRSIHHYIEEGLITPASDTQNGYKIFTEREVTQLHIIKKLRELDFSLSSIRSILKHPNTMKYHLYLQRKREEQEMLLHRKRMDEISLYIEKIPLGTTIEQIAEDLLCMEPVSADSGDDDFIGHEDAQLILTFMWGMFIVDIPMTEYRQYLWNKLAGKLELPENRYLLPVKRYFYSRPIEHVEAQFARRNRNINRIARLDSASCDAYVEEMKREISNNLEDAEIVRKWKGIYHQFLKPTAICADSTAHELLSEFCPRFVDYCKNINDCCEKLYAYLSSAEGAALCRRIVHTLAGYIDLKASHSGELAALASFRETVE